MAEEEIVQQETGKPVPDIRDYDGEPADTDIPEASEDARTVISIKGLKKSYWIVEPFKTDKGKIKLRKKVEYPAPSYRSVSTVRKPATAPAPRRLRHVRHSHDHPCHRTR